MFPHSPMKKHKQKLSIACGVLLAIYGDTGDFPWDGQCRQL